MEGQGSPHQYHRNQECRRINTGTFTNAYKGQGERSRLDQRETLRHLGQRKNFEVPGPRGNYETPGQRKS